MSALAAAGLAGCGGSGNDLLPERTAARMIEQLENVETAMAANPPQCETARNAAQAGRRRAEGLSSRVDGELKRNLIQWFEHLEDEARKECSRRLKPEETATAEPTETATPEATEEPEETPTSEPTETPTSEPTETPTAEPTPQNEEQGFAEEEDG